MKKNRYEGWKMLTMMPCSYCNVMIGSWCRTKSGERAKDCHRERIAALEGARIGWNMGHQDTYIDFILPLRELMSDVGQVLIPQSMYNHILDKQKETEAALAEATAPREEAS